MSRLKFTMGAFQKRFNLSHLLLDALNRIFETIIMPILSYNAEVWEVYTTNMTLNIGTKLQLKKLTFVSAKLLSFK